MAFPTASSEWGAKFPFESEFYVEPKSRAKKRSVPERGGGPPPAPFHPRHTAHSARPGRFPAQSGKEAARGVRPPAPSRHGKSRLNIRLQFMQTSQGEETVILKIKESRFTTSQSPSFTQALSRQTVRGLAVLFGLRGAAGANDQPNPAEFARVDGLRESPRRTSGNTVGDAY